jgi:hypothetical protein
MGQVDGKVSLGETGFAWELFEEIENKMNR